MSIINKAAVLNPFSDLTSNVLDYVPRATTSEFGIVAIGSGINVDSLGRIYLDTREYSDRLTAIEAQAASSLATQKSEVAAAIAQVNLAQSQTITALTLEVSSLKTNLTDSISATQTDLINRADQLAQNVTDITQQLTQDKAAFTKEIQDALVYLENTSSVASALRTPRKIQGVGFDGTQDITLPIFSTQMDGLVPKRVGATATRYLREDGTWVIPSNTAYALLTKADAEAGVATASNTVSAKGLKDAILFHTPIVTDIAGNAVSASKLQTSRTISLTGSVTGSVSFDGSANASLTTSITGLGAANGIATLDSNGKVASTQLPSYVDDVLEYTNVAAFPATGETGKIYVETTGNTTYRWGGTTYVKIASGEVSSVAGKKGIVTLTKDDVGLFSVDNTADASKSVASAAKLTTARTINGVAFDGTSNITIAAESPSIATITSDATLASATTPGLYSVVGYSILGLYAYGLLRVWSHGAISNQMFIAHSPNSNGSVAVRQAWTGTASYNAWRVIDGPNVTGNAATTTKLATARTINGVAFDGTANITIPDETPTATETVAGKAKIATTAIAQAGGNDTDIITAKKLRDAFKAAGSAPIIALRASGWIEISAGAITAFGGENIASITRISAGTFRVTLLSPLPSNRYVVFGSARATSANSYCHGIMLDFTARLLTTEFTFVNKGSATAPFDPPYIVFGVA